MNLPWFEFIKSTHPIVTMAGFHSLAIFGVSWCRDGTAICYRGQRVCLKGSAVATRDGHYSSTSQEPVVKTRSLLMECAMAKSGIDVIGYEGVVGRV